MGAGQDEVIETLVPIKLPPGLYRNGTRYEAQGRWYDANLVRFTEGTIQPVGGWRTAIDSNGDPLDALTGVPRAMHAWRASDGSIRVGIGSNSHAYAFIEGALTDITPASGFTVGDADSGTTSGNYGDGTYGNNLYGVGSLAEAIDEAGVWQLDNFGDYLVGVMTDDGKLWVWDGNTSNNFVVADATAPEDNRAVVVTPERFLVALGADGNPRKVQWADQESYTVWTPSVSNTAGDFELATNGRLMCGRRGRGTTLLWTDADLWSMTFIGGELIYSFDRLGDACGVIGPNAVAVVDGRAFWMGKDSFFAFDGFVQPVPCDVRDYVFEDFNSTQSIKVCAVSFSQFGEVWWFYPSAGSSENDRYVVYNYREGHWTFGQLARTAGVDRGALPNPMLASPTGVLIEHEVLEERPSLTDLAELVADGTWFADGTQYADGEIAAAETPFLESGPFELDDGNRVVRVQRIIPDEKTLGDVRVTFYAAMYPTAAETAKGPYSLENPTSVRFTARQVRMRLEQVSENSWRVGTIRLGVIPGGRR